MIWKMNDYWSVQHTNRKYSRTMWVSGVQLTIQANVYCRYRSRNTFFLCQWFLLYLWLGASDMHISLFCPVFCLEQIQSVTLCQENLTFFSVSYLHTEIWLLKQHQNVTCSIGKWDSENRYFQGKLKVSLQIIQLLTSVFLLGSDWIDRGIVNPHAQGYQQE